MIQLKPIEKWQFDFQIIVGIIGICIFFIQGFMNLIFELADMRFQTPRMFLSYVSSIIGYILIGFQIILFRPYPVIKNLLIVILILKVLGFLKNLVHRSLVLDRELIEIFAAIDGFMDLVLTIITIVMFGKILGKKFNSTPLVKPFRTYAIAGILIASFVFLFNLFWGFAITLHRALDKLWVFIYFVLPVPYIFLIVCYQKIKTLYPKWIEGKQNKPTENWPSPSTI